ncbi:hypothetical protein A2U01_0038528, partial [Trifolium medium]|nr:hypothetical protein [Trifolium medium]
SANILRSSENASLTNSAVLNKTRTISEILQLAVSGSNMATVLQ